MPSAGGVATAVASMVVSELTAPAGNTIVTLPPRKLSVPPATVIMLAGVLDVLLLDEDEVEDELALELELELEVELELELEALLLEDALLLADDVLDALLLEDELDELLLTDVELDELPPGAG